MEPGTHPIAARPLAGKESKVTTVTHHCVPKCRLLQPQYVSLPDLTGRLGNTESLVTCLSLTAGRAAPGPHTRSSPVMLWGISRAGMFAVDKVLQVRVRTIPMRQKLKNKVSLVLCAGWPYFGWYHMSGDAHWANRSARNLKK